MFSKFHQRLMVIERDTVGPSGQHPALQWSKSSQAYDAIGTIKYEFATLGGYRRQIAPPAAPPRFVVEKGEDNLELVINAPDLDQRRQAAGMARRRRHDQPRDDERAHRHAA